MQYGSSQLRPQPVWTTDKGMQRYLGYLLPCPVLKKTLGITDAKSLLRASIMSCLQRSALSRTQTCDAPQPSPELWDHNQFPCEASVREISMRLPRTRIGRGCSSTVLVSGSNALVPHQTAYYSHRERRENKSSGPLKMHYPRHTTCNVGVHKY